MSVIYTSEQEAGQIYMPGVNMVLLVGVLVAVLGFRSSSALAAAYGIAVTLTMMITTMLTYFVVRHGWGYPKWVALAATGFFLVVDGALVAGCALKIHDGGWFPLLLGAAIFLLMSTWWRGRALLMQGIRRDGLAWEDFWPMMAPGSANVALRTAVYPVADPGTVPQALLHNLKHNQVLHEQNVILTVVFEERPWVPAAERVQWRAMAEGFWQITLHHGFMERPDVPAQLATVKIPGLDLEPMRTSYFLSRETVVPTPGAGMALWREKLFAVMSRNAGGVASFFRLPDASVVELGTRVQI
jgi:KUP system potassium uptake protein